MMKRTNGHRHDRDYQPMLMSLSGEHIKSMTSLAQRTVATYNVRVRNRADEKFIQISEEFPTEDEAVIYCKDNNLDDRYVWVRIYSDKGCHVSGW